MRDNRYSIKDLENLTSIKAHTIRIWEQRYGLLQPKRTDTNIRYYEDNDLRKLLNINLLYSNGLKISKIAALSEDDIIERSRDLIQEQSDSDTVTDMLLMAIVNLNEEKVVRLLDELFAEKGMEQLYSENLIPLLQKIGELWQLKSISIGHEHFFSNLFRAFVLGKTAEINVNSKKGKKVLFFLPANEHHELSLLVYQFLFRQNEWDVIYLGSNVPFLDLKITYEQVQPDKVITNYVKQVSESDFIDSLQELLSIVPENKLILAGHTCLVYQSHIPKKVVVITSKEDMDCIFV